MKITLKDGSVKEYAQAMSVIDIAFDISEGLARVACAGEVNGEVVDLRTVLDSDCELNILTANDKEGLLVVRHTASHVLAEAVKRAGMTIIEGKGKTYYGIATTVCAIASAILLDRPMKYAVSVPNQNEEKALSMLCTIAKDGIIETFPYAK